MDGKGREGGRKEGRKEHTVVKGLEDDVCPVRYAHFRNPHHVEDGNKGGLPLGEDTSKWGSARAAGGKRGREKEGGGGHLSAESEQILNKKGQLSLTKTQEFYLDLREGGGGNRR
jgi:hypothetical protein